MGGLEPLCGWLNNARPRRIDSTHTFSNLVGFLTVGLETAGAGSGFEIDLVSSLADVAPVMPPEFSSSF